jgi:hypothetical protein
MVFSIHRSRFGLFVVGLSWLGLAEARCSKGAPVASTTLSSGSEAGISVPVVRQDGMVPARCRIDGPGTSLGSVPADGPVVVGGGVPFDGGYAIGLTHGSDRGTIAAIAWLGSDMASSHVVDIGPTPSDALAPRITRSDSGLVASYFARRGKSDPTPDGNRGRSLVLVGIDPHRVAAHELLATTLQQGDESMAFDLAFSGATGLLVWDEVFTPRPAIGAPSAGWGGRGVIRGTLLDAAAHPVRTFDVSPPDSDADSPRVVTGSTGFAVFWIANEPEDSPDAHSGTDPGAAGEERTHGWVEMLSLDARGVPLGSVRRLTPASGHVSSFDVLSLGGDAETAFAVVARDDGVTMGGTRGGSLVYIRATEGGGESSSVVPSGDLGRGSPEFIDARPAWVSWVGEREELRMMPLGPNGRMTASPSVEESLGEARPLVGGSAVGDGKARQTAERILAVIPASKEDEPPSVAPVLCVSP